MTHFKNIYICHSATQIAYENDKKKYDQREKQITKVSIIIVCDLYKQISVYYIIFGALYNAITQFEIILLSLFAMYEKNPCNLFTNWNFVLRSNVNFFVVRINWFLFPSGSFLGCCIFYGFITICFAHWFINTFMRRNIFVFFFFVTS